MSHMRPPAVAGAFYPDNPHKLTSMVRAFVEEAVPDSTCPKAVIAPHAGYVYSGPIAASALAPLAARRGSTRRVVVLGPSHHIPVRGIALSSASSFITPLGNIPVDAEALAKISTMPGVMVNDDAHVNEHSIEVELPFLHELLGSFQLVPLIVGSISPEAAASVLGELWGGEETVIVVSSDLSHFLDYETACRRDGATSKTIEALAPERLEYEDACGRDSINALLALARTLQLKARTVDLRNSGDTAGDRSRVVGYGAYLFN